MPTIRIVYPGPRGLISHCWWLGASAVRHLWTCQIPPVLQSCGWPTAELTDIVFDIDVRFADNIPDLVNTGLEFSISLEDGGTGSESMCHPCRRGGGSRETI